MSDKTMPITGGCLCGAVRYEASEPPHDVMYCHCSRCQKQTGSAFDVVAGFPADSFRITSGEPKFYKSSEILERGFCADCGSGVIGRYFDPDDPMVWVKVGTLDHPEDAPPTQHFGIESQMPWLTIDDDLPRAHTEDGPVFISAKEAVERGEG
jgi:hypothetical protein